MVGTALNSFDSKTKKFISVVIPARNEEKYLADCLAGMKSQNYGSQNYEILVVDNNSTDTTAEIAQSVPGVKYLHIADGPVGAVRNRGVREAKGDFIAFIDADCIAPENWLSKGSELLCQNENHAFSARYVSDENALWIEKLWLLGYAVVQFNSTDFLGGCIFVRKEDFLKVGGFDETITSGEDTKLAVSLNNIGIRTVVDQTLNVVHLGNAKDSKSFVNRQAWHSENYIKDIKKSIWDPTFVLSVLYLCSFLVLLTAPLFGRGTLEITMMALAVLVLAPVILSIKRVRRSSFRPETLLSIVRIYFIDFLYLIGRCKGILKGISGVLKQTRDC